MTQHAFVVTKPIQLINAINIIDQYKLSINADIILFNSFSDADLIFEKISSCETQCRNILYINSRNELYSSLTSSRYSKIFIDCDVGISNFILFLMIKIKTFFRVKFSVYEEGIGTYRNDFYPPLIRSIYDLAGIGSHYGGCILTSEVHVYNSDLYRTIFPSSTKVIQPISKSILDIIEEKIEYFRCIFNFSILDYPVENEDACLIYLSSWDIDDEFFRYFNGLKGDKLVKLHPAIRERPSLITESAASFVPNRVPAELLIASVKGLYKKVMIFHEGSSTSKYANIKNVVFMKRSDVDLTSTSGTVAFSGR